MKILRKFIVTIFSLAVVAFAVNAQAAEAPDVLIKRISQEVLDIAKSDRQIQGGNQKKVLELVEAKILPYVDFERMTALAAGRYWREATPEQQNQLTAEFRSLLVYTHSGAISQVKDQKLEFRPFRAAATRVILARGRNTRERTMKIASLATALALALGGRIVDPVDVEARAAAGAAV